MQAFSRERIIRYSVLAIFWLFALIAGPHPSQSAAADTAAVRLKSRTFVPTPGVDMVTAPGARRHGLVQFYRLPTATERAAIAAAGVDLLHYVPDNTWLAAFPVDAALLAELPGVRWVGPLQPNDKRDAALTNGVTVADSAESDGHTPLWLTAFPDSDLDALAQRLTARGARVTAVWPDLARLHLSAPTADALALADDDDVAWLELAPPPAVPLNDSVRANSGADIIQAAPYYLDGSGVQAAMWDFGVADSLHPDFDSRVTIPAFNYTGHHATHVAGIMGGTGVNSINHGGSALQWRGVAPGVDILAYDQGNPILTHDEAINTYGADVSQHSWGIAICSLLGQYILYAPDFDSVIRGLYGRPIPVVFAAGNLRNGCGTDYFSIYGGPQSAKNVITVGSINEDNTFTASNSSWGPTVDGRLKPEIVAVGVGVTSTAPDGGYSGYSGTSQAAPVVSGGIAIVQQHYRNVCADNQGADDNMLPATVRALLAHTAVDLDDASINLNPGPDFASGFGRIHLPGAVDGVRYHIEDSLDHGDSRTFDAVVTDGQPTLKVTLAWDDVVAAYGALETLVNDLDLELVAPDGTAYGPWLLDPTPGNAHLPAVRTSGSALLRDTTNVIEQVVVDNPVPGTWTVRVLGSNVPQGPQPFSLIGEQLVDSDCDYEDQPPMADILNPSGAEPIIGEVDVTIHAADIEDSAETLDAEMAVDMTSWLPLQFDGDAGHFTTGWQTAGLPDGDHTLTVRVTDSAGQVITTSVTVNTLNNTTPTALTLTHMSAAPAPSALLWTTLPAAVLANLGVLVCLRRRRAPA